MTTLDINKIDLSKLSKELRRFERRWVAISSENEIVANGPTYGETIRKVKRAEAVVLFKVPPMDYSLAPYAHEVQVSKIRFRAPRSH